MPAREFHVLAINPGSTTTKIAVFEDERPVLTRAIAAFHRDGSGEKLAAYSANCLRRVWKVQRFSWWMTTLLHRFFDHTPFEQQMQAAELDYVFGSRAASLALAENYVGLPLAE